MRNIYRAAATLMTVGLLIGGSATAAVAKAETIKDKRADVIKFVDPNDEYEYGTILDRALSTSSATDVTSFRVNHGKKTVSVRLKFAKLSKDTMIAVELRKNGKTKPYRMLYNTSRKTGVVITPGGKTKCKVKLTTKTGTSGSISTSIKRSCLDNPKKLKASAYAIRFADGFETVYVDPVSATKFRSSSWTSWLKAG